MQTKQQLIDQAVKEFVKLIPHTDTVRNQFEKQMRFIKEIVESAYDKGREDAIKEFEIVESKKWDDAEHCSCLRHAIWKAKGEPEEKV